MIMSIIDTKINKVSYIGILVYLNIFEFHN